jgi:hypothetical protein
MDSRLWMVVLVVLAGCGPKACGRSAPAPLASAPDASPAAAVAQPPAAPQPPEARLVGQYLVIVHSSPIPGEGEAVLEKLRAAGLGAQAQRVSTTPFASLRPCLEVVVAGASADKDVALGLAQRLDAAGVSNYLKNAGALAWDRERREADCRAQAQALAAPVREGASGPYLLDLRGERTFVLLNGSPQAAPSVPLRQVGEDRGFWMAALKEDPTGTLKKGDAFELYDEQGPIKLPCKVKGFAWLNRGIPHFGYFQQPEPPTGPGCGMAWPVAELDCSLMGTRARESGLAFVLPRGSPAPRYFPRVNALPEPVKAAQESALRALPEYAKARSEGQAHAQKQQVPLLESMEVRAYPAPGRQVVVGLARFQTGKGHSLCGGEDYWASVSRVVAVSDDGREAPLGGGFDGEDILAVMDLEGDGAVELLTRDREDPSRVALAREDGTVLVSSVLISCDSGC